MFKDELLKKIEDAKKAHVLWVRRIKHLIEEMPITEDMIALDPAHSEFGLWLYNDALKCNKISYFSEVLSEIEKDHINAHEIYFDIYNIYFVERKRGAVLDFVLGEKELEVEQLNKAIDDYNELLHVSEKLMSHMTQLERKVKISKAEIVEECLVN